MSTPPPPPPRAPGPPKTPARRPDVAARAEAIFDAALELSKAGRERFLMAECGDDEDLLMRVQALFAAHSEDSSFLEASPMTTEIEEQLAKLKPEETGERIGRYKLLQEIGEGGFGTVWMAEQMEPVSRKVALKIIKLGMDTREVIARFESERQALAMMDHPNIAKVFDAGATQHGRPFFVMELVKGIPITQYCDEAGLGTRARLALFSDVCAAINHAHQKGIIHRDIKPSNVMITLYADQPVVKVIDFGIAKATQGKLTDKTLFTRFEQFIGTPVYMSPEQAVLSAVDIDTRSDIYALGILLYELLVGKPPFDAQTLASAGYEEMRRIIREVEPVRPSSRLSTIVGEERTLLAKARHIEVEKLGKTIEPDLDWIVMKAIDKDRTRRYETANALAQDIKRHLNNEPVLACPPSKLYELQKTVRRHKFGFAAAAAVAAALLIGMVGTTWGLIGAKKANADLLRKNTELDAERDKVQARFDTAVKAIETFHTGVSEDALLKNPEFKELRTKLLKEAAGFYAELEKLLAGQTDAKSKKTLATGYFQLAELNNTIGNPTEAVAVHRKGLAIRRELAAEPGADVETRLDVARSLRRVGTLLRFARDFPEALRAFEEMRDITERLAALNPTAPVRFQLVLSQRGLAAVLSETGKSADGTASSAKILPMLHELVDANPANPEFQFELIVTYTNRGIEVQEMGKAAESLEPFRQALALQQRLVNADPTNTKFRSKLGDINIYLGVALIMSGRPHAGLEEFRKELAIYQKLVADQPAVLDFQDGVAWGHQNVGAAHLILGNPSEALESERRALPVWQKLVDSSPDNGYYQSQRAYTQQSMGLALARLKQFPEAITALDAAVAIAQKLAESDPNDAHFTVAVGSAHAYRGNVRARAGQPAEAAADLRRALDLLTKVSYPRADTQFDRTWVLALLAKLGGDTKSGVTTDEAKTFADQSVAMLAGLVELGWGLPSELKESEFDALRGREDFQKLFAEVEAKAEAPETAPPGAKQ